LHFDAARLRRLAALHTDVQHAVSVAGADGRGVDVVGQADDTAEAAIEAFVDMRGAGARSPSIVSRPRSSLTSICAASMPGAKA
jgi:hypothetical protein